MVTLETPAAKPLDANGSQESMSSPNLPISGEAPSRLRIRSYEVGFGDCFLLTFTYASVERHLLVDFGSTGQPQGAAPGLFLKIAADIARTTNGKLTAIVATHRHADHISGFDPGAKGAGTGATIRNLHPELVVQPWTEDPKLPKDAKGPLPGNATALDAGHALCLDHMQLAVDGFMQELENLQDALPSAVTAELTFVGEDNLPNRAAVDNLATMAANEYVYCGATTRLNELLPGVTFNILGPPTLTQSNAIQKERSQDASEFWQFTKDAVSLSAKQTNSTFALFPDVTPVVADQAPIEARWLIARLKRLRGQQMLALVRILDSAMNNTSVILHFRAGKKSFLFPGDAQIENWSYALGQSEIAALLKGVDMYKVGHHGSRNATPKTLWDLFDKKSEDPHNAGRLTSMVSTMAGKHGTAASHTEVPRQTLVEALQRYTTYVTTQAIAEGDIYTDQVFDLG